MAKILKKLLLTTHGMRGFKAEMLADQLWAKLLLIKPKPFPLFSPEVSRYLLRPLLEFCSDM